MGDGQSRRQFLKWVGIAPAGSLLLWELGCGSSTPRRPSSGADVGGEVGGSPDGGPGRDVSGSDATPSVDSTNASVPDAGEPDAGGTTDASADAMEADAAGTDGGVCEPTGADVEGPFHIDGAPSRTTLAGAEEPGDRIIVEGTVYGPDCVTPIAGALLDVWHADSTGTYDDSTAEYRLRGQMQTDGDGTYRFETIMPGRYPLAGSTRPAHVHFIISKPGFVPLTTQMYFEGDPFLSPNDPCGGGCNSGDPTLIVPFEMGADGVSRGTFDIVLTRP